MKLNGARLTLESQIIALEGTVTNADTVAAMKSGATAMKHARADVDADAVGDLMDDIQEEMATADEPRGAATGCTAVDASRPDATASRASEAGRRRLSRFEGVRGGDGDVVRSND